MDWIQTRTVDEMQWGFIVFTVLLVALIFGLSWKRRDDDAQSVFNTLSNFEDYGLGAVYQILVLASTLGVAWIGWRLPAEIEQYVVGGSSPIAAFPVTESWVGRLAQIVGMIGFSAIALRSMRYVVPIFTALLLLLGAYLAWEYVSALL